MPDQQPPEISLVDFFAQSPLAKNTLELPIRDAGDDQHREVSVEELDLGFNQSLADLGNTI